MRQVVCKCTPGWFTFDLIALGIGCCQQGYRLAATEQELHRKCRDAPFTVNFSG
uniref:Uncharacterized protein n=1 Tax=Rhizophora mucronata TaxID=61149 RepID=A0A2P2JTL0_RHIMU